MVFPYEQKAMRGEPMPDDLDWLDQRMYVLLRSLYADVNRGVITKETGIREKKKLVASYNTDRDNDQFFQKWVNHIVELWRSVECAANCYQRDKTIKNADSLVNAVYSLVSPDFQLEWSKES